MSHFVLELPLKVTSEQAYILDKRFEIARQMYNALANVVGKRYNAMIRTKEYRNLFKSLTHDKVADKPIWDKINKLRAKYRLTKYDFEADIAPMQHIYKKNIDSATAQKIADRLWVAYQALFYKSGKKIHYKKFGQLNSLESKSNKAGIILREGHIKWLELDIPIVLDDNNPYECEATLNPIAYNRIVRRMIRGKYKYYVQIVFRGTPPRKIDVKTGNPKHHIGKGEVGLDIGVSTLAVSSETEVKMFELADKIQLLNDKKRRYQRKLDRSRRATNPNNYNDDGTVKKGKKVWKRSKSYMRTLYKIKELARKEAAVRKYQHDCLANYVISLGDTFYIEKMNFKALQRRAKKTTKNSKGKINSKKRYGKTLANRAPAKLVTIIDNKLENYGTNLIRINTTKAKASQYNHISDECNKKKLSQRWNDFDGIKVQRDLYSAFLIMNINSRLDGFDRDKCFDKFDNFLKLHDIEIERLSHRKNLSCVGV